MIFPAGFLYKESLFRRSVNENIFDEFLPAENIAVGLAQFDKSIDHFVLIGIFALKTKGGGAQIRILFQFAIEKDDCFLTHIHLTAKDSHEIF